jgi:hypothetical protein
MRNNIYFIMLWLTGDIHGENSINRLSNKNFPEGKTLTKQDYVCILGDFGVIWNNKPDKTEKHWLKWLDERPFTCLFLDGNHENHPRLKAFPQIPMFDGIVGQISKNVFHLKRGEIYNICGKKIFTMGGAASTDKEGRREGISWWPEEVPSHAEFDYGLENLEKHQFKVDYILAHTAPKFIAEMYLASLGLEVWHKQSDPVERFLEHISKIVEFKDMYSGHWHEDKDFGKYHLVYKKFIKISDILDKEIL